MSEPLSRRRFLQSSALGASALALGARGSAYGFAANEKARVGFVGIGGRGQQLLSAFVKHCSNGSVAAVCDLIPDRIDAGKKIAADHKPAGYTDFRQMMDKEKLDGILVATAPSQHTEVVVPVLEAGFHCFAEKPMDTTVESIDQLTLAARRAWKDKGVLYQIGTQRRYHPGYRAGLKAIHDGRIGNVGFIQACWHWPWMVGRGKIERMGGMLLEQACHHVDVALWAMKGKPPRRCVAMAKSQSNQPEGPAVYTETHSATAWEFEGDVIFSYTHLFYLAKHFVEEKVQVHGSGGGIDLVHGMLYKFQDAEDKSPPDPGERIGIDSGDDWQIGTNEELVDFVENIRTGAKRMPDANVETGRAAALACIMGRLASVNLKKNRYEPSVVEWKDVGSKTDLPA